MALESKIDPQKMSTFCLLAYDIDDIPLDEPIDSAEVLKITMADHVPRAIMKDAYDEYITESYYNDRMEFL